jgi:hypothetical protein
MHYGVERGWSGSVQYVFWREVGCEANSFWNDHSAFSSRFLHRHDNFIVDQRCCNNHS